MTTRRMAEDGTGNIVQAYHFVGDLLHNGQPVPADGEWLVHYGPVELGVSGLHASRRPWHALLYAPGATLCQVEMSNIVAEDTDKLVARRRRIVRRVDLTADLRAFALQCARDVLHLWNAPQVVRRYLESGDETLRAAAWAAARDAARDAERAGAWDAAWAAAWAARDAARDTAWAAAFGTALAVSAAAARASASDDAGETVWDALGARFDALCRSRLDVLPASGV